MALNTYTQILRQGNYADYQALATKQNDLLYFCTDNGKLFKGSVDFTDSFVQVTSATIPAAGVPGKIYYESDTKKFKTYLGSAYVDITFPVDTYAAASISAASDENHVPTSKNVYEYGQQIKREVIGGSDVLKTLAAGSDPAKVTATRGDDTTFDVTVPGVVTAAAAGTNAAEVSFTNSTAASSNTVVVPGVVIEAAAGIEAGQVSFTNSTVTSSNTVTVPGVVTGVADKASAAATITVSSTTAADADVLITGVVTTPSWNAVNRILTLPVSGGSDVEVNIGKDIFLDPTAHHHYDVDTHELVLYLNDGAGGTPTEIRIPVQGMIPVYAGGSTSTATVAIDSALNITTNVKVDQHSGNAITIASDTTDEGGNTTVGGLRVDLSDYATKTELAAVEAKVDDNTANIAALAAAATVWGSFV